MILKTDPGLREVPHSCLAWVIYPHVSAALLGPGFLYQQFYLIISIEIVSDLCFFVKNSGHN